MFEIRLIRHEIFSSLCVFFLFGLVQRRLAHGVYLLFSLADGLEEKRHSCDTEPQQNAKKDAILTHGKLQFHRFVNRPIETRESGKAIMM